MCNNNIGKTSTNVPLSIAMLVHYGLLAGRSPKKNFRLVQLTGCEGLPWPWPGPHKGGACFQLARQQLLIHSEKITIVIVIIKDRQMDYEWFWYIYIMIILKENGEMGSWFLIEHGHKKKQSRGHLLVKACAEAYPKCFTTVWIGIMTVTQAKYSTKWLTVVDSFLKIWLFMGNECT